MFGSEEVLSKLNALNYLNESPVSNIYDLNIYFYQLRNCVYALGSEEGHASDLEEYKAYSDFNTLNNVVHNMKFFPLLILIFLKYLVVCIMTAGFF